jgi:AAA domain
MIPPYDAWTIARLLAGEPVNGELQAVSEPFRRLTEQLATLSTEARRTAFDGFLCDRRDSDVLIKAVADVNPLGPPPEAVPLIRPATLADLRRFMSESTWIWNLYIPSARIAGIAAFEGIGKTRFAMDLARRIWLGLEWPDGQLATFPEGTTTLWLCADGQQDELAGIAESLGMPDDTLHFNTLPDDPYGGTDLDDPEALERMEHFIQQIRPGLVFVDTLTNATDKDLCRANEVKALMTPIRDIAQRTHTTIILQLHLSKEGHALGRRIKGLTRTILQLDCPDPAQPDRLKLWVPKSFGKKPPALGVTMTDAGNDYDDDPPSEPEPGSSGRPPKERERATRFLREALTRLNDQIGNELRDAWEKIGGTSKTFWRAVDDMEAAGELAKDGGPGTRRQVVLHLNQSEPDAASDCSS